jgi:hypothetical protein
VNPIAIPEIDGEISFFQKIAREIASICVDYNIYISL